METTSESEIEVSQTPGENQPVVHAQLMKIAQLEGRKADAEHGTQALLTVAEQVEQLRRLREEHLARRRKAELT